MCAVLLQGKSGDLCCFIFGYMAVIFQDMAVDVEF